MVDSVFPLASVAGDARTFVTDLFTGAWHGDPFSMLIVGIAVLIVLRFAAVRWVYEIAKQTFIFGGLAYGVWLGSAEIGERYSEGWGRGIRYGGLAVVATLFFIMVYMFFLREARAKDAARRRASSAGLALEGRGPMGGTVTVRPGGESMRVGSGPLQHQGLPVHRQATPATVEAPGRPPDAAALRGDPPAETTKVEDVLRKLNVLGTSRDQSLLTVMVLILVAEFGVFTSRTIAAPNATVGMFLFGGFALAAVVYVKTSYAKYWTGVQHFVFATVFAIALSVVMLVYWQGEFCTNAATSLDDCSPDQVAALSWRRALTPSFYFSSDGLIATISGVAFSTLLTKGGK